MAAHVWPVFEFRPLPELGSLLRYAEGQWIPDDGEYDVAFISVSGAPMAYYVEPPYQRNIVAQWVDNGNWRAHVPAHPRGNAWHYALRGKCREWGGDWGSRSHANRKAGDRAMDEQARRSRCANGRSVQLTDIHDKHVLAGLVRERDTKKVYAFPKRPKCMYCGATP